MRKQSEIPTLPLEWKKSQGNHNKIKQSQSLAEPDKWSERKVLL